MKEVIFITGGSGFIGGHLAEFLAEQGYQVTIYDLVPPDFPLKPNMSFIQGDILDSRHLVRSVQGHDIIFHLAAMVGVVECLADPEKVELVNINGTKNVIQAGLMNKIKRLFFASSSEVYGEGGACVFFKESDRPEPKSIYAKSKTTGERYVLKHRGEMKVSVLRFCNVYGPRQREVFVIPKFIRQCLVNDDIQIAGTGTQLRTYTYISDALKMINVLLKSEKDESGGIFNISSNQSTSLTTLARTLKILTGSKSAVKHFSYSYLGRDVKVEILNRQLSSEKISSTFGVRAEIEIFSGLKHCLDYISKER